MSSEVAINHRDIQQYPPKQTLTMLYAFVTVGNEGPFDHCIDGTKYLNLWKRCNPYYCAMISQDKIDY